LNCSKSIESRERQDIRNLIHFETGSLVEGIKKLMETKEETKLTFLFKNEHLMDQFAVTNVKEWEE
jgi:hypothetical protein